MSVTSSPNAAASSAPTAPAASPVVAALLDTHRSGFSLPGPMYHDPAVHAADLDLVWHREWVFAGHECELAEPGAYLTLTVGRYPLMIVRGADGVLRALHNVCRHRGAVICEAPAGNTRRKIVCPYHQWAYELDGSLYKARAMPADLTPAELGLRPAHVGTVGGLVFVCAADTPPPFETFAYTVGAHLAPFGLAGAKIAHEQVIVEQGNWKLVVENNRECYHCRISHPELAKSFPITAVHTGGGTEDEVRATNELVARCEAAGLASGFLISDDFQYRVMRMALEHARSMTMDGEPAVARRWPGLPAEDAVHDVGDVLMYHYPSMWSHYVGDHALTFRMLPTSPTSTELRTTWLVPADAVEGEDYDLKTLTEVWAATNDQDAALVERTQRGVSSPAYVPGPYSPVEEEGVIQFIDWYTGRMRAGLSQPRVDR